mmetsp:Transcript_20951/g.34921  ORF Transcript_20951/g.34921 Transcript_20951/m.34921 type:complete len:118 (-) Transcript_20951:48-401(-)
MASSSSKVKTKNSLDQLEIKLQSDVDWLTTALAPKLKASSAKKAPYSFVNGSLNALGSKLTMQEAESLQKLVKDMVAKRKKLEQEAEKKRLEEEEKKKKEELPQNEVSDADFFAQYM